MTDKQPSSPGPDDRPPPYHSPYGQAPGYEPPPGYGPPPGGGYYDPRWGYGPPGSPYGPYGHQGPMRSDDTNWAMFSYLGMLFAGFIPALVIYLIKKRESPYVRFHAAQALNYQLTLLIQLVVLVVVALAVFAITASKASFVLIAPAYLNMLIGQWVFIVLGAVKSGKGQLYRFPTFFCYRMVR